MIRGIGPAARTLKTIYELAGGVLQLTSSVGALVIRDTAAGLSGALTKWQSSDGSTTYAEAGADADHPGGYLHAPDLLGGTRSQNNYLTHNSGWMFYSLGDLIASIQATGKGWVGSRSDSLSPNQRTMEWDRADNPNETALSLRHNDAGTTVSQRIYAGASGSGPGGGTQRALYIDPGT